MRQACVNVDHVGDDHSTTQTSDCAVRQRLTFVQPSQTSRQRRGHGGVTGKVKRSWKSGDTFETERASVSDG